MDFSLSHFFHRILAHLKTLNPIKKVFISILIMEIDYKINRKLYNISGYTYYMHIVFLLWFNIYTTSEYGVIHYSLILKDLGYF